MDFRRINCLLDLHLHLDGSISLRSARELALMSNVQIPENDRELQKKMAVDESCRSLNDYLEKFDFPLSLLQTEETLSKAVENLCREIEADGVMYVEIRFAPQLHLREGLSQRQAVEAALRGLRASGLSGGLILCLMRGSENGRENRETVEMAAEYLGKGVAAADLAGAEALFPTGNFREEFLLAKRLGVPFTIHAGEAAGAESVQEAVSFGAVRIGHGINVRTDASLMRKLAEKKIALEVCPKSNLDTHTVETVSELPLRRFMEEGIPVTINSDNMTVSDTSVRKDLELVTESLQLTDSEIRYLLENAVHAAFCEKKTKKRMLQRVEAFFSLSETRV